MLPRPCVKMKFKQFCSLRKKCSYSELFRPVFSRIWTEYGEIPVRMQENVDQYNSEYGHFLRSGSLKKCHFFFSFEVSYIFNELSSRAYPQNLTKSEPLDLRPCKGVKSIENRDNIHFHLSIYFLKRLPSWFL